MTAVLNLSRRNLRAVPSLVTELKARLTALDLSFNKITFLPNDLFVDSFCDNVESLNLGDNLLLALPNEIAFCQSLVNLKICNNQLPLLPEKIGWLVSLCRLDASGNRITTLQSGTLSALTGLTILDLSRNMLAHVQNEDIWTLTGLQELSLSFNRLERLPVGIGCLTNLTALRANNNALSSLEPDIVRLPLLRDLQLSQNNLTRLHGACWRAATALTALDLSRNDLDSLPHQLGALTGLTSLSLARNPRLSPRIIHAHFAGGAAAVLAHLRSLRPPSAAAAVADLALTVDDGVAGLRRADEERRRRRRERLDALVSGAGAGGGADGAAGASRWAAHHA
jgi:leucine-rich repeat protein SHOC2